METVSRIFNQITSKLRTLFHPIIVFIGVQIAWIFLMGIWINWYFKNREDFATFAKRFKPELLAPDLNWVVLLEGCLLMMVILVGVFLIFVFWNKQARLNRLQSNFISSVSHELKSPLASIQLYLETIKYQDLSPQETREFVDIMLSDTERLSSLIENILEASSPDTKKLQLQIKPVEMKPFLQEMVEEYQWQFEEKQVPVSLDLEDAPVLPIDKRAMHMVFSNLIGNALRYSPKGAPLTIKMHKREKYCDIEFQDNGIGLDEKERKKVFRKFYRVQNSETQNIEGAGLGLFLSREIVNHHNGKIKVRSGGRGKGCVFTVSLPMNGAATETTAVM